MKNTEQEIFELLSAIPDPEVPVINIDELGVLRKVEFDNEKVIVTITPTYSGCPAMKQMEDDILRLLHQNGFVNVEIKTSYLPAWTTDWLSESAKMKLIDYGISPPEKSSVNKESITGKASVVMCPRCKSTATVMVSQFGSTACKALYKCLDCLEPFDYFKCL